MVPNHIIMCSEPWRPQISPTTTSATGMRIEYIQQPSESCHLQTHCLTTVENAGLNAFPSPVGKQQHPSLAC